MSFRVAAVGTRRALTLIAIACALSFLGTLASAQNPSPKDEIFGGYSWLAHALRCGQRLRASVTQMPVA
jgi:hypothetical protein